MGAKLFVDSGKYILVLNYFLFYLIYIRNSYKKVMFDVLLGILFLSDKDVIISFIYRLSIYIYI